MPCFVSLTGIQNGNLAQAKSCPVVENKREHGFWLKKCPMTMGGMIKEHEEHIAENSKTTNSSSTSKQEMVGPLDD